MFYKLLIRTIHSIYFSWSTKFLNIFIIIKAIQIYFIKILILLEKKIYYKINDEFSNKLINNL